MMQSQTFIHEIGLGDKGFVPFFIVIRKIRSISVLAGMYLPIQSHRKDRKKKLFGRIENTLCQYAQKVCHLLSFWAIQITLCQCAQKLFERIEITFCQYAQKLFGRIEIIANTPKNFLSVLRLQYVNTPNKVSSNFLGILRLPYVNIP